MINLADKLKELRKSKNVSQEKLAEYLGVSYQAVSKWENGVTSPDILLLPDIARYYGITVDELLQVEHIDADRYIEECNSKAEKLFRDGKRSEIIPIWREAYKKLPNDIRVKSMLMSIYFDTDNLMVFFFIFLSPFLFFSREWFVLIQNLLSSLIFYPSLTNDNQMMNL